MTVCTVCGKVLNDGQETCPDGHQALVNVTTYAKELQRTGSLITLTTENGLTSKGLIQLVTENGLYLFSSSIVDDPVLFSWEEIDTITSEK